MTKIGDEELDAIARGAWEEGRRTVQGFVNAVLPILLSWAVIFGLIALIVWMR